MNIFEFNSSCHYLIKKKNKMKVILTPKISFRLNPSDMKNYST